VNLVAHALRATFALHLSKAEMTRENCSAGQVFFRTGRDGYIVSPCPAFREVCLTDVPAHEVTLLLQAWSVGDEQALGKLIPLVHQELHRLARRYMAGESPGHTLQTTALVNEAYLRLVDVKRVSWQNRAHFFGISAQLMRQILVDVARSRRSLKRGGDANTFSLEEALVVCPERGADVVALDDALTVLTSLDARRSRVVELRFFGGLSVEETAEVLKVSPETVMHDWKLAKAWLLRELSVDDAHDA
jgi:RNA polymerase sigma-70 factor, ECF subfamily